MVIVADDSTSMNTKSDCNQEGIESRWDEQYMMVKMLLTLCNIFDEDGVDVWFLNRGVVNNVKDIQDERLVASFATLPSGATPLTETLSHVLRKDKSGSQLPKLVFIVTDGCPNKRGTGESDVKGFRHVLATRDAEASFISIVACTGDNKTMSYLNSWDKEIPHLDVIDDFISERNEVRRVNGRNYPFSYGDYVVKALLAPLDDRYDRLDETLPLEFRIKEGGSVLKGAGCCCIL